MGDTARMSKAPVYYALIQARFTPVRAMKKYVDDIQDALRLKGYPLYEENTSTQFRFEFKNPGDAPVPALDTVQHWYMSNAQRTAGFVLSNDFITFQTMDYGTHEDFIQEFLLGLSQIFEYVSPALVTRLGMRYLDAVLPGEGENIEQYLCDGLHGVQLGLQPIQSVNEQVFQTKVGPLIETGVLVARIHKMHGQLAFPPDMIPVGVELLERFRNTPVSRHGIIDTDHYVEGNMPPELAHISAQLHSLHGVIKESFNKMITQYALQRWA
ncbi:TIGR04255 family protein [Atlantibacter hermannii]|uniref:TIGR04255 family protein n=1 Tax=Atlantibacter hermannii TaxID=565 RepID=UPI002073B39D|nr:TIGR04255 family protein [Atlantibacter hermannii]